jgi:hypothetical protein
VGHQLCVRGGDVRVRRVPLHENRAQGDPRQHGRKLAEGRLIAKRSHFEPQDQLKTQPTN